MLVPRYQPVNSFRRSRFTARHALAFLSCVCLLLLWHWHGAGDSRRAHRTLPKYWSINDGGEPQGVTNWPKPRDFRIVGLVFFGRPVSVSILDCYLKRNLASNGGFLDEVIFLARTQDEEHLAWLDKLLETEPAYTRVNLEFEGIDYATAYDVCENGTMYIKMDDDLVFIEDHAIATIVQKKLNHPEYFVVAANVVNQPSLSWMHWRMGAIKPYMPELEPPPPEQNQSISRWRASDLPTWDGPPDWTVPVSDEEKYEPPFEGHRWLPLPEGYPLENTPIASTSFDAFSQALWHWSVAAQEHYSFLENLEKNELWRYKFHTLDYYYMRMGIQMIAIWGDDIIASDIHHGNGDDEYHFTEVMTKQTGRHAVVDGRAIVSHFTFLPQRSGLESTDILDRYRAFAAENICPR